jgi:hypothetical protein
MSGRQAVLVFALALAARLVNVAFLSAGANEFFMDDSHGYWEQAETLLTQGWFHWLDGEGSTLFDKRPPLYMYFLALVRAAFGPSLAAAAAVQAVLDSVTCVVIGLMGAMLRPRFGIVAGVLAALWPNLVIHSALIVSDTLFLFLFTPLLYAGARFVMNGDWRWIAAAGLLFGLAVVTRHAIQFLPVAILVIALAVPVRLERGWGAGAAAALAFTIAAAPLPSALLLRNVVLFETPALTAQTGNHLFNWVAPEVRFAADGTLPNATRAENTVRFEAHLAARGLVLGDMSAFAVNRELLALARADLARLPATAFAKAWVIGAATNLAAPPVISDARVRALPKPSFAETVGEGFTERVLGFLFADMGVYQGIVLAGLAFMALVGVLELWGLIRLAAGWPWIAALAAGLVLYTLLVTGPVGAPKYRMPIEPVLIVLAATALVDLAGRFGRRRTRPG